MNTVKITTTVLRVDLVTITTQNKCESQKYIKVKYSVMRILVIGYHGNNVQMLIFFQIYCDFAVKRVVFLRFTGKRAQTVLDVSDIGHKL